MKRRSRYSDELIGYVLTERGKGAKWKEIINGIKQEFQTKSPSERQMRAWLVYYRALRGTDQDRMVRETLVKIARDSTPIAAFQTLQFTVQEGIPTLMDWYRQTGDPYVAGVVTVLCTLEKIVGSKLYDEGTKVYQQERERKAESAIPGFEEIRHAWLTYCKALQAHSGREEQTLESKGKRQQ